MTKLNMFVALNFVYLNSTLNRYYTMSTRVHNEFTRMFARIVSKNHDQEFHKILNVLRIYSFRGR
jgi:hypothetical protein